jgi:glutamyl-tRNA reductase
MICKNSEIVYKNFFNQGIFLMRIGVVGINYRLAELKLREALARTCQRRFGPGKIYHPGHTFVLLSTCNRTEVYFCSDDLTETHSYLINILRSDISDDFDQKLYSFFGTDCFHHLSRVTAGLDSAIVAETEIQGQVKIAYEKTTEQSQVPSDIHFLFQKSLQIGKKVRSKFPLQRGIPNLEHAILSAAANTADTEQKKPAILFIGASDINLKILNFLKSKGYNDITLCNRTWQVAKEYADTYNVKTLPWDDLQQWSNYDWIITGTKAQEPLITVEQLKTSFSGKKTLFDLSVPRNIDPAVAADPRITLWNIDQLNSMLNSRRQKMNHLIQSAEYLVATSTENYLSLFRQKEQARQALLADSCIFA